MTEAEILVMYGRCGPEMGDTMAWPQILQDGVYLYMFRRQPSQLCRSQ